MINYRLSEDQLTAYLKTLKAGRKSLDAQGKKLLDALFFYQDRDGDPDYDWTRIAIHFRQERRGKICTAEDVLPPALYPVLERHCARISWTSRSILSTTHIPWAIIAD